MDNNNRQLNEQVKRILLKKKIFIQRNTIQEHENAYTETQKKKMKETEIWKLIIGHLKQTSMDIYSVSILVYLHCWSAGSKVPCRRQILFQHTNIH